MTLGKHITALQTKACLLFLLTTAVGCQEENRLQITLDLQLEPVKIERLDQRFFELTPVSFRKEHMRWQKQYGELYVRYIEDVLALGGVDDTMLFNQVRLFTTDPSIAEVQAVVKKQFPDLNEVETALTRAWSYYQYYFPNQNIPQHISFMGGFNTPAALTSGGVGIGLEMFLGRKSVYYDYLQIPGYLRHRMGPEFIAPTVLKGWLETEFPLVEATPTLLDAIVAQGKVLYCLDAIFPFEHDTLKIAYTKGQLGWAQEHEQMVWAHFIDKELLYSTDLGQIQKYTNDGPFTVDLVKESPSRMGYYIGWQIVRSYMENMETVDLQALMATKNAKEILHKSKYKP